MKDGYEECERCGTRRPPAALELGRCREADFCSSTRAARFTAPLAKKRRLIISEEQPEPPAPPPSSAPGF